MEAILTVQFDSFDEAQRARAELRALGVTATDTELFALNAPGQHDRHPLGGDEDADRGARDGDTGALTGAALGGAAGLALGAVATPLVGPLAVAAGAAVGAYTGSLAGAVNSMGDDTGQVRVAPRPAGIRLALRLANPAKRDPIVAVVRRHGARSIEEAQGTWRDASWVDFDPTSIPRWIDAPPGA